MNYHQEIFRYLPVQAIAAGFIPLVQFVFTKFTKRQKVHRQRELRENIIALDLFIGNMNRSLDVSEHHVTCLHDALQERALNLAQLASFALPKNQNARAFLSRNSVRRLFLLYAPSSTFAWVLHWIFFFFLIAAFTGLVRVLFHIEYLRPAILVPLVIADFILAVVARLASFYVDRPTLERLTPAVHTA